MVNGSEIFVQDLGFAMGGRRLNLEESHRQGFLRTPTDLLSEAGFKEHCTATQSESALDLARQAIVGRGLDFQNVDALYYATCLPQNGNVGSVDAFTQSRDVKTLMDFPASHLQAELKMEKAFVAGFSQQACCSLLFAIRSAHSLLVTEKDLSEVICVTADRFPEGALYEQAYNVISDGAAACRVSRNPQGFRLISAHAITNGALAQASDDETVGTFFNYVHRLILESLQRAQMKLSDLQFIVPQNMNQKAWDILASILGFKRDRIALPTLSQVGHMISGDNIVNLKTLDEQGVFESGDRILLPMAGFGLNWHSIILEKV